MSVGARQRRRRPSGRSSAGTRRAGGRAGTDLERLERENERLRDDVERLRRANKLRRQQAAERRQADAERVAELEGENRELRQREKSLKAKVAEQKRIIEEWKRGHRVRSKPRGKTSKDGKKKDKKKDKKKRKKPGRKPGHEGAQRRMPDHIDQEKHHHKDCCDNQQCSDDLEPTGKTREYVVENVIPARVENTKHVEHEYVCVCCGKVQWSEMPPEYGTKSVPGQPILGPSVLPHVLDLRFDVKLSFHGIADYFGHHIGMPISPSGIWQMVERAGRRTASVYDEILLRARASRYLHMDETSWWEDGTRLWSWLVSNLELSLFHIDPSRGHKVVEKLLCELDEDGQVVVPYEGPVVTDFMGAYAACSWMLHQYCWIHLLRDAKKEAELDPCAPTEAFRDRLLDIYKDALEAQESEASGAKHGIRVRLGRLKSDAALGEHTDVARLQKRIDKEFHNLLLFLDLPGLPAHNNQAELDTRAIVVFRKIVYGTRSESGTRTHAHFMTLGQTARKQGWRLGEFVRQTLDAIRTGAPPPSIFQPPD